MTITSIRIEPAEREHGGRALHDKSYAKARQTTQFAILTSKKDTKNIIEHQWTINQQSIKRPPKILEKSTQNRSWRRLGAPWGLLRASWCLWGRLESFVGASWGRLGGLLGRLGAKKVANMAPTWFPKRSPNRSKSKQKTINFWMPLGIGFLKDFGGFLDGKWSQVGIKMASEIDLILR